MEKRDATRYGVRREDVYEHMIGARSFLALFPDSGDLTNVGAERRALMDSVRYRLYGRDSSMWYDKLQRDLAKARAGRSIYCEGAGQLIFPEELPRPEQKPVVQRELDFTG